jgi:ribosomal protein L29
MSEWFVRMKSTVLIILVASIVLGTAVLRILRFAHASELRQKDIEELKAEVFRYEDEYFSLVGHDTEVVMEFKQIVRTQDIIGLKHHWKRLRRELTALEKKAGIRGRPMLHRYYPRYEMVIDELLNRYA